MLYARQLEEILSRYTEKNIFGFLNNEYEKNINLILLNHILGKLITTNYRTFQSGFLNK